MPDLEITVEGASVVSHAASPVISFRLRVVNTVADEVIDAVVLRAQLQLEVTRRKYSADEESELRDLFGSPDRWGQTLRAMLWTHASVIVPSFVGETHVELQVPCTFDFNVAATKYFHGLQDGEVPVAFLFSGSIFYEDNDGALKVLPVSWEKEAKFRLPVATWRELMDTYYPNVAWLNLRRDVFERLYRYKVERGIPTWEQAIESILAQTDAVVLS
ncbi:MAG: DUF6084 family protein [Gemmatimonadaceae bacterium]